MRTQKAQDSHQAPESSGVEKTEQTWRVPRENISDEVTHLKTAGVGKAKRKTRRGKRGGVKRKMQNLQREHKKLEAAVGHWIKDIRHKMEAPLSDHAPSRDVTVDVLASDVDEMSITPSHVEPLLDYEHYFPDEIDNVIDNRVDDQSHTGSAQAPRDIYSYHGNNSTTAPGFGQLGRVLGCGNEPTGHHQATGCGYGNGQGCGFGYGNGQEYGFGYGNGQEYGFGYGNGQEYGFGYGNGQEYRYGNGQGYGYGNGYNYGDSFYRYCD